MQIKLQRFPANKQSVIKPLADGTTLCPLWAHDLLPNSANLSVLRRHRGKVWVGNKAVEEQSNPDLLLKVIRTVWTSHPGSTR